MYTYLVRLCEYIAKYQTSTIFTLLEISMSGLSRRTGIYKKIGRLIQQDWESAEEIIKQNKDSRQNQINQSKEVQDYEAELAAITASLNKEMQL